MPTRCSEDNETCFACVVAHQGLSVMWTTRTTYVRSWRDLRARVAETRNIVVCG
jgi:hypothetical protein